MLISLYHFILIDRGICRFVWLYRRSKSACCADINTFAFSTTVSVMSEGPSQAERLAVVKFARYTALTADKMAGILLGLTTQLEEIGILHPNRQSKAERDRKMNKHACDVAKSDQEVGDMLRLIPNHPDAEELIQALLGDIRGPTRPEDNAARDAPGDRSREKKDLFDMDGAI